MSGVRAVVALVLVSSGTASGQTPTPTPGQCPYTFATNFPNGTSCGFSGTFNTSLSCPTDVAALLLSNGSLVVAGISSTPVITFGAVVGSPTAATLIAYFVGDDLTPQPISGTMELQDGGRSLVIDPDTSPFDIGGCSFDRYVGTFTQAFTSPPTPTPTFAPYGVSGHVRYYSSAQPVGVATVQLIGPTPAAMATDATGQFAFSNIGGPNWRIEPQKTGDAGPAISALDAVYVLQSVVGVRQLSFEQRLAGDVSGNGTLSTLDAVLILQRTLNLRPDFPVTQACGSDWAFVPVPAVAPNQQVLLPQMQIGSCQKGAITFDPLAAQADGQDFEGILFGDPTGNWQPTP